MVNPILAIIPSLPEWVEMGLLLWAIILVPVIIVIVFVGMWRKTLGIVWYLISLQPLRRWMLKKRLTKDGCYFRDPPAKGNMKVAATVTNAFSPELLTNYSGLFGALFLRLFNKKAILIENRPTIYGSESHTVLIVAEWNASESEQQSLEWKFYCLMKGAAGLDGVLQPRELQQYMRARGDYFEPFVKELQTLSDEEKKMARNYEVARQVFGLKHFLEDFSLIADRQIRELPLWSEYLVYATLFGIADKVCDDFADVYPDYFKMNQLAGTLLHLVGNNSLGSYASAAVKGMELNSTLSKKDKMRQEEEKRKALEKEV